MAEAVRKELLDGGWKVELLDGDAVRQTFSRGLGFTREDREANIRRIAFVAQLLARNGIVVLVAAISPYRELREQVRQMFDSYLEVYVNAPLSVCEQRDLKHLYRRAREGTISGIAGADMPYEPPLEADVECRTDIESLPESALKVLTEIRLRFHTLQRVETRLP
jgi:adenylylsulfate kinase